MPEKETFMRIEAKAFLTCPHCRAGEDGLTIGLYWEISENAWRCIKCGHRSYEQRKKSPEELLEDLKWDMVLETLDPEPPPNIYEYEENEFEENSIKISLSQT